MQIFVVFTLENIKLSTVKVIHILASPTCRLWLPKMSSLPPQVVVSATQNVVFASPTCRLFYPKCRLRPCSSLVFSTTTEDLQLYYNYITTINTNKITTLCYEIIIFLFFQSYSIIYIRGYNTKERRI